MTEVERRQSGTLADKLQYAQALATASLLPGEYRKQPGNVLLAMELGESLGLDTITAINQVNVIDGKPSSSAALISALVRRAGHRLRVTGDDTHAVAEIIRADDPRFPFRAEWTIDRAKRAGLTGKGAWVTYPAAMLKARAITECARDACQEALFGMQYTSEELGADVDEDGTPITEASGRVPDPPIAADDKDRGGAAAPPRLPAEILFDVITADDRKTLHELWNEARAAGLLDADVADPDTGLVAPLREHINDRAAVVAGRVVDVPLPAAGDAGTGVDESDRPGAGDLFAEAES